MADDTKNDDGRERITVLAKEFTPAAMEYHRRRMGNQGYSLAAPITAHKVFVIEGPGEPTPLLGGEEYFAATFIRKSPDDED